MFFKQGAMIERLQSTVTSAGTLTLINTSQSVQILTGSLNHSVVLPNATTMSVGERFDVVNLSTGTITVFANDGTTILGTVPSLLTVHFRLVANGTTNGTWDVSSASSTSSVSAADLATLQAAQAGSFSGQSSVFGSQSKLVTVHPDRLSGDFWVSKSGLLTALEANTGMELNGYGYSVTGFVGAGGTNNNQRYDQDNNYWINRALVPVSTYGGFAFQFAGFGYFFGVNAAGNNCGMYQYTDTTNTWTTQTAEGTTTNGVGIQGFVLSDAPYLAGGFNTSNGVVAEYDTINLAYRYRASMIPQSFGGCFTINDLGYVTGGGRPTNSSPTTSSQKYNASTNAWLDIALLPTSDPASYAFAVNGLGYEFGNANGAGTVANISPKQYVDYANYWTVKNVPPNARGYTMYGNPRMSLNGIGYLIGGPNTSGTVQTWVDSYRNFAYVTVPITKKSVLSPSAITAYVDVYASVNNKLTSFPSVRVRTDGDNWRNMLGNVAYSLPLGDNSISARFQQAPGLYVVGGGTSNSSASDIATSEFYVSSLDTWYTRASMATARGDQGAFQLNGLGYVIAGQNASGTPANTTEQYSDVLNTFTTKATTTTTGRNQGPCAFATIGYGYIAGGDGAATILSTEQYNDVANTWTTKSNMVSSQNSGAIFTLHDFGFIGAGDNSGGRTNNAQRYNPITDAWASVTSTNSNHDTCASFSIDGFGYGASGWAGSLSSTVEQYNDQLNSWSNVANVNSARESLIGSRGSINGFGYATCGDLNPSVVNTNEQYNVGANAWTTKTGTNTARTQFRGGGTMTVGNVHNYEVQVGIAALNTSFGGEIWVTKANLPVATQIYLGFNVGGQGYATGGYAPSLATNNRFDDVNNVWLLSASLPQTVGHGYGLALGGKGYSIGGDNGSVGIANVYAFDPTFNSWLSLASLGSATTFGSAFSLNGFGYLAGGNTGSIVSTSFQYSTSTNSWTSKAAIGTVIEGAPSKSAQGYGYLISGYNGSIDVTTVQKYNDGANVWTTGSGTVSQPRGFGGAEQTTKDNILFMGGVNTGSTNFANIDEYQPLMDLFVVKQPFTARQGANGFRLGTNIFACGGNAGSSIATVEEYTTNFREAILGLSLEVTES